MKPLFAHGHQRQLNQASAEGNQAHANFLRPKPGSRNHPRMQQGFVSARQSQTMCSLDDCSHKLARFREAVVLQQPSSYAGKCHHVPVQAAHLPVISQPPQAQVLLSRCVLASCQHPRLKKGNVTSRKDHGTMSEPRSIWHCSPRGGSR